MDTFNIKLEKRNAISKHNQSYKIPNFFRFIEVCVVMVLISSFTTHLPLAVKNSGEYVRGLSLILFSPRFVFIVGNAIIITLFAKAGQFSAHGTTSRTNLYEEFVEKSEKITPVLHRCEIKKKSEEIKIVSFNVHASKGIKNIRRTQSENLKRVRSDKHCKQLGRLGSEKYVKPSDPEDKLVKSSSCTEQDVMSNEQFRDTVEAFIARQRKLLREEEYSVICNDLE